MKKIVALAIVLFSNSLCLAVAFAPIEVQNLRQDLKVFVRASGERLGQEVPFRDETLFVTVDSLVQKPSELAYGDYFIEISKATGGPAVRITSNVVLAGSRGEYKIVGMMMPQDSLVGFLDGKRVNLWGNSGMGAKPSVTKQYRLPDGTSFEIVMELIFESYYRKVKFFVK